MCICMENMTSCYILLVVLRFALVFVPQTGYIHPDEFFQSPEVIYGDVFKVKHFRTWEFTTDAPIRSVVFPYITVGLPAFLMKRLGITYLIGTQFFPYLLLVIPRLVMCFISLIHDVCIYQLFLLMDKNPFHGLVVFASSYVSLVYLTRTLSNTLEAACETILIYLVAKEIIMQKFDKTPTGLNEKNYYIYGVLISVGCFMRPTFGLFSIVPMFYLIFICSSSRFFMIIKSFHCFIGLSSSALAFAFLDTAYYAKDIKSMIHPLNITTTIQDLIFAPLNFLQYNIDMNNLLQHGYHPLYLHIVVNIPLSFSLLGICGFINGIKVLTSSYRKLNEHSNFLHLFYLLSTLIPLVLLSTIPHQEPRFLIPLMFPLLCFCAEYMYDNCLKKKFLAILWILTNFMGVIFWGFFHQGGIYLALSYFHTAVSRSMPSNQDIVFFHTYMPPVHLMGLKQNRHPGIRVHDFAGASDPGVYHLVHNILQSSDHNNKSYLIAPSSVTVSLVNLNVLLSPTHQLRLEKKFFPHLSIENLPILHNIWNVVISQSSFSYKIRKLKDFFSLNVYRSDSVMK